MNNEEINITIAEVCGWRVHPKDKKIQTLPLDKIQVHVNDFLATAFSHPEYEFLLTKIGCGLALYEPKDIAPLFKAVKTGVFDNVILPKEFYDFL